MPDEYKQSPRIEYVGRDAHYHYHEAPPPRKPWRPKQWGLAGGLAALVLGGTLATTQLSARPAYYCASHNVVKYHTDPTCQWLRQCGARIKRLPLSQAKERMEPCKACH